MRAVRRANQLVEFELHRMALTILGVLNQEDHQKGDDRRAGVDDQLPGVAEVEYRTRDAPYDDGQSRNDESGRMARGSRRPIGEVRKRG